MVTNLRVPRRASADARERAQQYINEVGENATDAVNTAESCVRKNPESAVWTAFLTGIVLGAVMGWISAERHEHRWFHEVEDAADRLRRRFRW